MTEELLSSWKLMRAIAIAFFVARVALLIFARPFMDETYYWMWGQHLALSYFDHPALAGWTQWLAGFFGWNVVAMRLPVFLTLVGDLVVLVLLSERMAGERWRETFWLTAAIFLSTPIFILLTGSALPDHLLVFFSLLAVYAVESFKRSIDVAAIRWRWLYLAGLAIGLATLSKYTGALLGLGLLVYFVTRPRLRAVFRSPHLYLVGLLAVALQLPVLIWNVQHGFASFGFVVQGRSGLHSPLSFTGATGFLLGAIAVLSPFFIWPLAKALTARDSEHGYSRIVFWVSTLAFLAASLFTNILIHWNAVAYVVMVPFVVLYFRPRALAVAQLTYGALAVVAAGINFTLLPLTAIVGPTDRTSGWSYGWDEVAAEVAVIQKAQPADFIAATDYALASPLGFALHDLDVTSLSAGRDAYDDWFDPAAHRDQSALIVADRIRGMNESIAVRFTKVVKLKTIEVNRFGRRIDTYTIYRATGFAPD